MCRLTYDCSCPYNSYWHSIMLCCMKESHSIRFKTAIHNFQVCNATYFLTFDGFIFHDFSIKPISMLDSFFSARNPGKKVWRKTIPSMLETILGKPDYWWETDHWWLQEYGWSLNYWDGPEPVANKGMKRLSQWWGSTTVWSTSFFTIFETWEFNYSGLHPQFLIFLNFIYQKMPSLDIFEFHLWICFYLPTFLN